MMKVAYTGWTWITSHEPEAAKHLLSLIHILTEALKGPLSTDGNRALECKRISGPNCEDDGPSSNEKMCIRDRYYSQALEREGGSGRELERA